MHRLFSWNEIAAGTTMVHPVFRFLWRKGNLARPHSHGPNNHAERALSPLPLLPLSPGVVCLFPIPKAAPESHRECKPRSRRNERTVTTRPLATTTPTTGLLQATLVKRKHSGPGMGAFRIFQYLALAGLALVVGASSEDVVILAPIDGEDSTTSRHALATTTTDGASRQHQQLQEGGGEERLAVVVPAYKGDLDRAVASLERWPTSCSPLTLQNVDLVLYYAEGETDREAVEAASRAIAATAGNCFANLRTVYANLQEQVNERERLSSPCNHTSSRVFTELSTAVLL